MSVTIRTSLAALVMLLLVCGTAYASPVISLQTLDDWDTSINAGLVRPMTTTEFSDLVSDNLGFDAPFSGGIYSEPLLQSAADPDYLLESGESISGPGLYMGWGTVDQDTHTAAWRYEYPLDPNIIGQTLTLTVNPPRFVASGAQMNAIGIGFTDLLGFTRTWTWNTAAAAVPATSTIAWNQNWNVSIGPIAGPIPPAFPGPASATDKATGLTVVPPIFFSSPAFNPATAMFLDAYENGGAPVNAMPLPNGGIPNVALWNWWQNVVVTPEPGSMALLCGAAIPALLMRGRRRRSSR